MDKRGVFGLSVNNFDTVNITVKKLLLSPVKEEAWLNDMANEGFALVDRSFLTYDFIKNNIPKGYKYTVCYLQSPPTTETSAAYIRSREEQGTKLVCTHANYAYFLTPVEDTDNIKKDAVSKRSHIGNLLFLQGGIFLFWLCMLSYHLIYWLRFMANENTVTAKSDFIYKISIDLSSVFGNYKTTPYISFYLMLVVIFAPLTVYYLDAYIGARKYEKSFSISNEE